MISAAEEQALLSRAPAFDDSFVSLMAGPTLAKGMIDETKQVVAYTRKFCDQVVRPLALELDRKTHEDHDFLAWDFVKKASDWGFYTMWLPRLFGGRGTNMGSLAYCMEEIASVCVGLANVIGVHYLGVGTLSATWNAKLMRTVLRDVVDGEKKGEPRMITLAVTEPSAGTDVEEVELIDKGNITCQAKRVDGGYVINGTKVFISNGHLSRWHMLIAYEDLKRPSETMVMMAVKTGMKGFSFGRHEDKMGQRACPASELVFSDCFVPDELVATDRSALKFLSRDIKRTSMQMIDYVVSTSRAGVGAFAAGAARGAMEKALEFAGKTVVNGKLLVNNEWAQCMLAEMYRNWSLCRMSYVETNYANTLCGAFRGMHVPVGFHMARSTPAALYDTVMDRFLKTDAATRLLRNFALEKQEDCEIHRTSGLASLCKFSATDLAVENCHLALTLMGGAGLRQDAGAEKFLRDAKLLQIYEGTNQLNRLNLFKCLMARQCADACVFEEN
ncbi:MAG: acyl-CoA dehydrogenase family protein [Thermodesulfobacteriota bacterium]